MVDPQRDAWRFMDIISKEELTLEYIFETHVHNDYISGMHQLRDVTGSKFALPAEGHYNFSHKAMKDGDTIRIGDLEVSAFASPGHTYEHTSWMVKDPKVGKELALFTGGSLIVGSSGRTDLLGHHHHGILTEHQFETLEKYKQLPQSLPILPTHGAGSFCTSSNTSVERITTIGRELDSNRAFQCNNLKEFDKTVNNGLLRYPTYYKYMAGLNRNPVKTYSKLPLPLMLKPEEIKKFVNHTETKIIDLRDRNEFAMNHLKGSYNIELTNSFASYYGWLLPIDAESVLVINNTTDLKEAMTQLLRIGYEETVKGYILSEDLESLERNDQSSDSLRFTKYKAGTTAELLQSLKSGDSTVLIDVRDPTEFNDLKIDNSFNIFFADIPNKDKVLNTLNGNSQKNLWVYCVSGERSAVAASLLEQEGFKPIPLVDGGINTIINGLKK